MSRLVCGVGVNDLRFIKADRGMKNRCPFYPRWRGMLQRCYCSMEYRPTYKECFVCEDWLIFSNFKEWMKTQDWKDKHLDKDILKPGNKVYSLDTCCFVTPHDNVCESLNRRWHMKQRAYVNIMVEITNNSAAFENYKEKYQPLIKTATIATILIVVMIKAQVAFKFK